MNGTKAVVLTIAALGMLGTGPAAGAAYCDGPVDRCGGFVKPCSLDGVNPAYHPDIFGYPAFARAVYGFVQARDGSWRVVPNCHLY